jgi:GLPGLI family protein
MKKLIILALFLFVCTQVFSQSIKGVLVQEFISSVGSDTVLTKKEKSPLFFDYRYSQGLSYQNLITVNKSSIEVILKEQYGTITPVEYKVISPTNLVYYKDFNRDVFVYVSTTDSVDLAIKDKLSNSFIWELVDETKVINGFSCKKATTVNKLFKIDDFPITAWYCEKIPINDGPYNYTGLPGFIIRVEIGNLTSYTFENLVFNDEDYTILEPINSAAPITFEEFKRQ